MWLPASPGDRAQSRAAPDAAAARPGLIIVAGIVAGRTP